MKAGVFFILIFVLLGLVLAFDLGRMYQLSLKP
jgi:hypothetical protein